MKDVASRAAGRVLAWWGNILAIAEDRDAPHGPDFDLSPAEIVRNEYAKERMNVSDKPDGGAAFPTQGSCGMSLRDYFAGQALAALVSSDMCVRESEHIGNRENKRDTQVMAEAAYAYADAMLVEREK